MYPSESKKYSGIFVKNQYQLLTKLINENDSITLFVLRRKLTNFFGSFIKYSIFTLKFIKVLFKKYDIVHLHYFYPLIFLTWVYKLFHPKTKLIVTFHGSDINFQVNKKNLKVSRFLAKKIDIAIPVGQELKKIVLKKLNLKVPVYILPAGVDDSVFYYEKNTDKKYDFTFVGSFFKVKGIDILYKIIKKSPSNIQFCVIGKGKEYENKFIELINKGYNLTLKIDQNQNDLRKIYNQSRFLLQPSRSEGYPTVTIEAMFCGTPVITSDIPQFNEQVINGVNGYTLSFTNLKRVTNEILKFNSISDQKYNKLKNGAINSNKDSSLSIVCKNLLKIYKL